MGRAPVHWPGWVIFDADRARVTWPRDRSALLPWAELGRSRPIVGQEAFPGHLEWVDEHRDGPAAKVEVAPFHDPQLPFDGDLVGLALLDVETLEAARAVVELDPLIASGAFEYRLYEWRGGPLKR